MPTKQNLNNANSSNWLATFDRHENVVMKVRGFPIPSIQVGTIDLGGPSDIIEFETGNRVLFEDLELEFLIDSDWVNYIEIYKWLRHNAHVGVAERRDLTLVLLDNAGKPQGVSINFQDAFPTALGSIKLDVEGETTDLTATATLKYREYVFL